MTIRVRHKCLVEIVGRQSSRSRTPTGLSDLVQTSCLGSRSPILVVARTAQLLRRLRRGSNVVPSLLVPTLQQTPTSPELADIHTCAPHNPRPLGCKAEPGSFGAVALPANLARIPAQSPNLPSHRCPPVTVVDRCFPSSRGESGGWSRSAPRISHPSASSNLADNSPVGSPVEM